MTNDLQPLRPLTLEAQDGSKHAFRPQADMTPLESALISQLFIRMVMSVWNGPVDWPTYVEEHKLDRHFTLVETPFLAAPILHTGQYVAAVSSVAAPRTIKYVASRDIVADTSANPPVPAWPKGDVLTLLEGMPVPDGFVPVIEYEDLGRRDGSTRSAG